MSGKAKVALGAQATLVLGNGRHGFLHLAEVRIKDGFAVEHDLDSVAFHGDFLSVPFAGFLEEPALGGDHAVGAAVVLRRMKLGIILCGVVEYLQFAHAHIGGVPFAGVTNGEAIVAAFGQFDLQPHDEVAIAVLGVDGTTFAGLALDGAVSDLVVVNRAGPTGEIIAVEERLEAFLLSDRAEAKQ